MANSNDLRQNINQHKPKNVSSKADDDAVYAAMHDTIAYLETRLKEHLQGYSLEFQKHISFETMIAVSKASKIRSDYDPTFYPRTIKPDGGLIVLKKNTDPNYFKIVAVSEVKRQGTNDAREKEGLPKQAQGNAIERLGKNLIGIKTMLNHEKITPFACFGWGDDFEWDYTNEHFVMSKISMLNEFYPINKIYVHKKDGSSDRNYFSPTTMYFRKEQWTRNEMAAVLKEIGETALRYYIF